MPPEQFKPIMDNLFHFFHDHGIELSKSAVCTEKEWTDFRFTITKLNEMERVNKWLIEDLKALIIGFTNIDISAPIPMMGKEHELRIRVYEFIAK